MALAALDLAAEVEVQVARVEEARQVVRDRELLGALEEDGVLDRDRAGLDEGQHEGEVVAGEAAAELVDDLEDPDRPPARHERRAEDRPRLELRPRVHPGREARVARRVVDDRGLAALRHPAGDALPDLQAEGGDVAPLGAEGGLEHQLLLLLVHHEERPGLGGDELADLLDDQLDHLARLEDRVGRLHHVGEDGEPPRRGLRPRGALAARPRRGAPRTLQVGEHGLRERVRGTPGLDHEVEPEAVDPPQRPGIGGDGQAAHGPCGEGAPRRPHRARGGLGTDREEGPGEPPRVEPRAAAGGGGEELVLEPSPRGRLQAAAERGPAARTGSRIPRAEEDGQACHPGGLSPRP